MRGSLKREAEDLNMKQLKSKRLHFRVSTPILSKLLILTISQPFSLH